MPSRFSSSGMQSIRRELQRRKPKLLPPKSSDARKPSAPLPPPTSRSAPSSVGSSCASTLATEEDLRPGTAVGVRTRTTTLKTGEALVLWLRAMIVSLTSEGYEVVYDGNWPPGEPYGTVHIPRRHVRMIKPSPSPTTPPPSLPSSSTSDTTVTREKEMRPAFRPTTAGKSLRPIRRSLLPEMERQAQAASPGY